MPTLEITAPLPNSERLPVLDILRGVALMGILIMNMPGFNSSFFAEADGSHLWAGRADQAAASVRDALFAGKFNSMFSLLFGIGFTIQFTRMAARDPDRANGLYLRRLAVLALLGVVHAWVFWPGDVLHIYAVLGLLLVLGLRRASDRAIVCLIVACIAWPAVSGVLRVLIITPEMTAERVQLAQAFELSNNAAYGHGSFIDTVRENTRVMNFFYGNALALWNMLNFWVMFGMTMLIGLLAGRRRWVQRAGELMPQVRRLMWWALAVGLGCGVGFSVIFELNRVPGPSPIKVLGSVCYSLSRLGMMVFYVLVIVRLAQQPAWQRRLAPFAAAGRMPLTNYLVQTAICLRRFVWHVSVRGRHGSRLYAHVVQPLGKRSIVVRQRCRSTPAQLPSLAPTEADESLLAILLRNVFVGEHWPIKRLFASWRRHAMYKQILVALVGVKGRHQITVYALFTLSSTTIASTVAA